MRTEIVILPGFIINLYFRVPTDFHRLSVHLVFAVPDFNSSKR